MTSGVVLGASSSNSQTNCWLDAFLAWAARSKLRGLFLPVITYSKGATTLNSGESPAHDQFFPQKTKSADSADFRRPSKPANRYADRRLQAHGAAHDAGGNEPG